MATISDLVKFPAKVTAQSPLALDIAGADYNFSLDVDALNLTIDELDGEVSVLSFPGVDPTGATNSSAAFQAAMNAIGSWGRIVIPAGTYKIDTALTGNAIWTKRYGVTLTGSSPTLPGIVSSNSTLAFVDPAASANQRRWQWSTDASGQPVLQLVNDAGAATTALTFTRSGSTPTSAIFATPQGGTISSDGAWSLSIAGGRTAFDKWSVTDTYTGSSYGSFISYHKPQKTGGGNVISAARLTRVSDFQDGGTIFHDWEVASSPLNPASGLPGAPVATQNFSMLIGEWNIVNRYADGGYQFNRSATTNWSGFWQVVPETQDFSSLLGGARVGYNTMFGFFFGESLLTSTATLETAKTYNAFLSAPNFLAPAGRFIRIFGGVSYFKSVSSIGSPGSGYVVGNILPVSGGTLYSSFYGGQIEVTSVDGSGGVTGARVRIPGYYSALPSNPASVTGGAGTGATFNLTGSTSSDYPEAIMEIEGAWNKGIKLSGATFVGNAYESPGASINNAGLIAATGIGFGSTVDVSNSSFARHISIFGTTYGIGLTAGRINYVSAGSHRFMFGTTDVGWFDTNGVTALTLTLPHGSTPTLADGRVWTTTGGMLARINGATKTVGMLETANTWTALQTFNAGITVSGGTLVSSTPTTIAQTWNNVSETFIGFGIDITNTNSASGSQPFRIRLDGNPIFFVDKFGSTTAFTLSATGHIQTPNIYGGSVASSSLSLYSTAGAGTTDKIAFYTGSQVERWDITTSGHLKPVGGNTYDIGDSTNTVRDIFLAGGIYIGGNKIIGARDTGWTAMTGTANENTAYDTATVTLAQLAGRVMALQAALTTHGMIGA